MLDPPPLLICSADLHPFSEFCACFDLSIMKRALVGRPFADHSSQAVFLQAVSWANVWSLYHFFLLLDRGSGYSSLGQHSTVAGRLSVFQHLAPQGCYRISQGVG